MGLDGLVLRVVGTVGNRGASEDNYLDVTYPVSNWFNTSHVFRAQ